MRTVNLKLDQVEAELQDLNSQESKDEASLAKVWDLPISRVRLLSLCLGSCTAFNCDNACDLDEETAS